MNTKPQAAKGQGQSVTDDVVKAIGKAVDFELQRKPLTAGQVAKVCDRVAVKLAGIRDAAEAAGGDE
jgi:hypothetical protein